MVRRLAAPWKLPALVACLALTLPSAVGAAGRQTSGGTGGGHGQMGDNHTYFDPDRIVTVSGTLTTSAYDWDMWGHGNHTGGGVGANLRADGGEEFDLMLAPAWFLNDNGISLSQGERITVTASRVEGYDNGYHHGGGSGAGRMHDEPERDFLIATIVEADGRRVVVRDSDGYPLWRGGDGWGAQWFDPDSVTVLTGTLTESLGLWSVMGHGNHTGNGMHYGFETGGASYYAMLGPWWFMESQGLRLDEGQRATIVGSVTEPTWDDHSDRSFLIATEITVGGTTVRLRDEFGYPLWAGTGWHYYSGDWSAGRVVTTTGDVVKIRRRKNGRQLDAGYEIMLRSDRRSYRVFVAPDWYVDSAGMTLRRGDTIRIRGSMSGRGGRRELVAQYIDAGAQRWKFRNRQGAPLWVMGNR